MTRQDFELIASVINTANIPAEQKHYLADYFADHLVYDNSQFNRTKFINTATEDV